MNSIQHTINKTIEIQAQHSRFRSSDNDDRRQQYANGERWRNGGSRIAPATIDKARQTARALSRTFEKQGLLRSGSGRRVAEI